MSHMPAIDTPPGETAVTTSRQIIAGPGLVGGGDLSADRTISLASSAGSSSLVAISVALYGADPSGASDNSTAFTNAAAAAAAAKVPLFIPGGTYLLTAVWSCGHSDLKIVGQGATIRFASSTRKAISFTTGASRNTIEALGFEGDNQDDYLLNLEPAIELAASNTDIAVERCRFYRCIPLQSNDNYVTERLRFHDNDIHNAPGALHPPSKSTIVNCDFHCDTALVSRTQAIYVWGQQEDILIQGCRFLNISNEDIQIRSTNARYLQRGNFRILGNTFVNSMQYSVWIGSDDHPLVTQSVIADNTFVNCVGPIANYSATAIVHGNLIEYTWEFPYTIPSTADGIICTTGVGGSTGRHQIAIGTRVYGNTIAIRQPWFGKVTINSLPANGDTLTIGGFVYVWKTSASAALDIPIAATTRLCAENLVSAILGDDAYQAAPNNVIRYATDCFNNLYGDAYGSGATNVVGIASWFDYGSTFSRTGTAITLTAPIDYRQCVAYPINVQRAISAIVEGNTYVNTYSGPLMNMCHQLTYRNNTLIDMTGTAVDYAMFGCWKPSMIGNRKIVQQENNGGRAYYAQISAGFPVNEDDFAAAQQYSNPSLSGRSGVATVGNGKAYALYYYGRDDGGDTHASKLLNWTDGDACNLYDGATITTFRFKRTSPGAGQFNTADTLRTLINAVGPWTASYVAFQNDLGGADQKEMLSVVHTAGGTGGNTHKIWTRRFKNPTDAVTYSTVPQPMINGQYLRDRTGQQSAGLPEEFSWFYGGAATLTKTFVYTQLANRDRGVSVSGYNSASQALAPVVYQADIIPGVGFTITHAAAAGTERFFWRVN